MIEKLKRYLIVLFLLSPIPCSLCPALLAQQPTSAAPVFLANSKYVQGRTWADYKASAGAGLTLNIAAGTAYCGNPPVPVFYAGGTLALTASQTNYVYLDPAATCVPAFNVTGFAVGQIPLAKVVTGASTITSVTDVRTWFVDPNSSGPVIRADLMPGANAGEKIANAIIALFIISPTGGTVDARGLEGAQTSSVDWFAGATGPVKVILGHATYTLTTALNNLKGGSIEGQGPDETVLDFTGATGTFTNDACVYAAGGGLTALPALAANIALGSKTITLVSAPSVSQGDVLIIYDSANYSYSGFRTDYKAGEYAMVDSVAGAVITLTEPVLGGPYASGSTVSVYKMTSPTSFTLRNLQVIGRGGSTYSTDTIKVKYGKNAQIINVKASGSPDTVVSLDKCYSCSVDHLVSTKLLPDVWGTSYALAIGNSQGVRVTNSDLLSVRHGLAVGGGAEVGDVVNRNLLFHHNLIRTSSTGGSVLAGNIHGNAEYITYDDNVVQGINVGGNKNRVINNTIYAVAGEGVHFSELKGFDFDLKGNQFSSVVSPPAGRGYFVDVGGSSADVLTVKTTEGGTLNISGNRVNYGVADDQVNAIKIVNRGSTAKLRIRVNNNNFVGTKTATGNSYALITSWDSGSNFESVEASDNKAIAMGYKIGATNYVNFSHNSSLDSGQQGLYLAGAGATAPVDWKVTDNYVRGAQYTGMLIAGGASAPIANSKVSNNFSVENNLANSGASSTDTALTILYATTVQVQNNWLGGTGVEANYPAYYEGIGLLSESGNYYYGTGIPQYVSITAYGPFTYKGQLVSSLATGTAPFTVASTTPVANLSLSGGAGTSVSVAKLSTPVNVVTFSATPTFDASLGNTQKITLTANVTSSTLSNASTGQSINFTICQDATGSRTFVWPTNVLFPAGASTAIGATASKCSTLLTVFDGTNALVFGGLNINE